MKNFCRRAFVAFSVRLIWLCHSSWRHPRALLVLLVLLTALFTVSMGKLRVLFSADDMIDEGIPSADELKSLRERFEQGMVSYLWVVPPAGQASFTPRELCQIRHWFSVIRATRPEFKKSTSTFDLVGPARLADGKMRYVNLLPLNCRDLSQAVDLEAAKRALDASPWPFVRDKAGRLSLFFGFYFAESENRRFGVFDPGDLKPLRDSVETDLREIIPKAGIHWVGSADYQWYIKQGFRFSTLLNSAMILFLFFALRLVYGTWSSGLLFSGTLIVASIWILGGKALAHSPYDILSSGLILMLAVSALEDFTFLSSEQMKGQSWKRSLRAMIVPSFFTSLTTMIGFASLCVSNLGIIRRLGFWAAYGALLEWVLVFIFIPAFMLVFYRGRTWVDAKRSVAFSATKKMSMRSIPRRASLFLLVVYPLVFVLFPLLNFDDSPHRFFPAKHEFTAGINELRGAKQWTGIMSVLFEKGYSFADLEPALKKLEEDPVESKNVVAIESPQRIVDWLQKDGIFTPELARSDYRLSQVYHELVDSEGVSRALVYVKETTIESLQRLKNTVASICSKGECHLGGELVAYSDFAAMVPRTLIDSMLVSLLLVALTIGFLTQAFGKEKHLWQLILTAFWGPLLMICVLAALRTPMDFMKSTIAAVLVGLAGDNAIQYLFAARKGDLSKGIEKRGTASVHTAIFMACTALIYLGSYFAAPKAFGVILAAGLIASLVGDLWILKGLTRRK